MTDHEHDFWAQPFGPMKCAHCPETRELPDPKAADAAEMSIK